MVSACLHRCILHREIPDRWLCQRSISNQKSFLKSLSAAEISSKEYTPEQSPQWKNTLGYFLNKQWRNSDKQTKKQEKLMRRYKSLHQRNDVDRLHVLRKEGGWGVASIENYEDATIQGLEKYTKKSKERLITAASNSNGNSKTNKKTKKSTKRKNCE